MVDRHMREDHGGEQAQSSKVCFFSICISEKQMLGILKFLTDFRCSRALRQDVYHQRTVNQKNHFSATCVIVATYRKDA